MPKEIFSESSGDVLRQLAFVSSALRAARSRKDVLEFIIATFIRLGFDRVRVWLIDLETRRKIGGKSSYISDRRFQSVKVPLSKQDEKNLPLDYVKIIKKKRPFINRTFPVLKKYFGEKKLKYSVEFPLFAGNQPLGLISVDNAITNKPIDLKTAETTLMPLANHVALVLYRVVAEEKSRKVNVVLKKKVAEATVELKNKNEELEKLALYDELSNLPNRRYLESFLAEKFAEISSRKKITYAMLDIDFLKHVNDTKGHQSGDKLISQIGRVLAEDKRIDFASRFAGDEFVFLLIGKSPEAKVKILKSIIEKISKATGNTASIGCVTAPNSEVHSPIDLMRIADDALYHAKHTGRNRFVCASDNLEKIVSLKERRLALQEIESQGTFAIDYIRQLKVINQVSEYFRADETEKRTLEKTCRTIRDELGFKKVGMLVKENGRMQLIAHSRRDFKLARRIEDIENVPRLPDWIRTTMEERKVMVVPEKIIPQEFVRDFGIRKVLLIPLLGRKHVLGVIIAEGDPDRHLRQSDLDFLLTLGDQIESGITKARAVEKVAGFNRQLKREIEAATEKLRKYSASLEEQIFYNLQLREDELKTHFELISALVASLEEKDVYTRGHSVRVASYAMKIGRSLKLDEKQLTNLRYSALLHDIGKVAIDQSILHKRTALTEAEAKELEKHPVVGEKIVSSVRFLKESAHAIRHHHERWDGKGYPDGERGEKIPLKARIIGVADAYDAMVTRRSYGHKMSKTEAIKELRAGSGKQFDPKLAKLFIKLLQEGKIRKPKSKFVS